MPDLEFELKQVAVRLKLSEAQSLYSTEAMTSPDRAVKVMADAMAALDREYCMVVNLDSKLRPINFSCVSVGGLSSAQVPITNVFKSAILSNAGSIMLLHNHPSGSTQRSEEDVSLTKKIIEAGRIMDIPVIDHVIVAGGTGERYSFREDEPWRFSDTKEIYESAEKNIGKENQVADNNMVRENGFVDVSTENQMPWEKDAVQSGNSAVLEPGIGSQNNSDISQTASAVLGTIQKAREAYMHQEEDPSDHKGHPKKEYTKVDRAEQMKEITAQLEKGVQEFMTSEKYTTFLNTVSKFHHYSFNNQLLIAMQRPDATLVAGYTAWQQKFDRHVLKGEKGIKIIAPAPVKTKQLQDKIDKNTHQPVMNSKGQVEQVEVEVTIPRFKVTTVFDQSQTDGKPLPTLGAEELKGNVQDFDQFMKAIQNVSPVPIRFDDIEGGAKGYYSNAAKEIVIKQGMSEAQIMKTAVHECIHSMLHDSDFMKKSGIQKDAQTKEVEALY